METKNFDKLLLKTAFSCMACDGDIDKREIKLIKKLHKDQRIFGELDVKDELSKLLLAINEDGHQFLKTFFSELTSSELSEDRELKLVEVAIHTIIADERIEYSEIKFFKVIRSKLKISNQLILEKHPDFEDYLEQDIITDSYLSKLQEDFFDTQVLPEFEMISINEQYFLDNIPNEDEN